MKTNRPNSSLFLSALALLLGLSTVSAAVYQTYNGNGAQDGAGGVGLGSLSLYDSSSVVHGTFNVGGGDAARYWNNYLVLYFDTRSGGFTDTSGLTDNSTAATRSVSGYNIVPPGGRATAIFAPNFCAEYALVLSRSLNTSKGLLYELAAGQALNDPVRINCTYNTTTWTFDFNLAAIGATGNYFKFESTATSSVGSGYRYLESFETLTGVHGFNTVQFNSYNSYGVEPVPESTSAALLAFGCIMVVGGAFARVRRQVRAAHK